jgi:hypothetical protein
MLENFDMTEQILKCTLCREDKPLSHFMREDGKGPWKRCNPCRSKSTQVCHSNFYETRALPSSSRHSHGMHTRPPRKAKMQMFHRISQPQRTHLQGLGMRAPSQPGRAQPELALHWSAIHWHPMLCRNCIRAMIETPAQSQSRLRSSQRLAVSHPAQPSSLSRPPPIQKRMIVWNWNPKMSHAQRPMMKMRPQCAASPRKVRTIPTAQAICTTESIHTVYLVYTI